MSKETLFVAIATQKGGMGKTALTVLAASRLHYVKGYNVAVIDCDYPQHSVAEMRRRDIRLITEDLRYKRMAYALFKQSGKTVYTVEESSAADAISAAERLQREESPDIIFFDLPGTLNTVGVVKTLASMDYVFVPVSADRAVLESALQFASAVHDNLITTGRCNIKELHLVWTMVDGREKSDLYDAYNNAIAELGLQTMRTRIPDAKRFRRETSDSRRPVFRSTVFPTDRSLVKGSNIEEFVDEMCDIIHIDRQSNRSITTL
jgi:cellulose biosynthesis protein BcsQ